MDISQYPGVQIGVTTLLLTVRGQWVISSVSGIRRELANVRQPRLR